MDSALLLGHTAGWWDAAMLGSLGVAALVAFLVAGATAGSVVANKREAAAAREELERYKAGVSERTAEARAAGETAKADAGRANEAAGKANERAKELEKDAEALRAANLKLEAQIAPRRISQVAATAIAAALRPFAGRSVVVKSYALDAEGGVLCKQVLDTLEGAGINVIDGTMSISIMGALNTGIVITGPNAAFNAALRSELAGKAGLTIAPLGTQVAEGAGMFLGNAEVPADASILIGAKPIAP